MGIRTRRFSAAEVEADARWVAAEIAAFAAQRAVVLAGAAGVVSDGVELEPVEGSLDELAEDPRRLAFPPEPPGWSAFLPACRTVLPETAVRRSLVDRLGSLAR